MNIRLVCRHADGTERKVMLAATDFKAVVKSAAEKLGCSTAEVVLQIKEEDELWEIESSYWKSLQSGQALYAHASAKTSAKRTRSEGGASRTAEPTRADSPDSSGPRKRRAHERGPYEPTQAFGASSGDSDGITTPPLPTRSLHSNSSALAALPALPERLHSPSVSRSPVPPSSSVHHSTIHASPDVVSSSEGHDESRRRKDRSRRAQSPSMSSLRSSHRSTTVEVWDKLKAPDQVSSRRKWSVKEDHILFNELRAYLKSNKQPSYNAADRQAVFARILAEHGSDGTKTRVFAGRSAQALRTRASARVRNAMEKRQPVPQNLQALFRWRRVPVSTSIRSRQATPGPNDAPSLSRRRSFIVVQDDSSDGSDGEDWPRIAGYETSEDELDLCGNARRSASAASDSSSYQRDSPERGRSRDRETGASSERVHRGSHTARSQSAHFSAEENARDTRARLAALNPFAPASTSSAQDHASATMINGVSEPLQSDSRPAVVIKTERLSEHFDAGNEVTADQASEVDELGATENQDVKPAIRTSDAGISAPDAEPALKHKFVSIMSESWEPFRTGVRQLIEESAASSSGSGSLRLEDLPFSRTAQAILDLMLRLAPEHRMDWPPTDRRVKGLWVTCCSAIAASVAFAVFEDVAPAHWSVRRACFAVAGYLSALVQLPGVPDDFRGALAIAAVKGLWSLRAAKRGGGYLETEAEDLAAALLILIGGESSRQEVLHSEMSNTQADVLQASVGAIKRHLEKLESSIRFVERCPLALSWGSVRHVPATVVPSFKSRRMLQLWVKNHPQAPAAISEDYQAIEATLARWSNDGLLHDHRRLPVESQRQQHHQPILPDPSTQLQVHSQGALSRTKQSSPHSPSHQKGPPAGRKKKGKGKGSTTGKKAKDKTQTPKKKRSKSEPPPSRAQPPQVASTKRAGTERRPETPRPQTAGQKSKGGHKKW